MIKFFVDYYYELKFVWRTLVRWRYEAKEHIRKQTELLRQEGRS